MSTIGNALNLLRPGERAIVIFTQGGLLTIDPCGTGSTGNWKISSRRHVDKVIIYRRDPNGTPQDNDVFIGDLAGLAGPGVNGRYVVRMRGVISAGRTPQNWNDFANAGANPVRYLQI